MEEKDDYLEIDILHILNLLWNKLLVIVITSFICASALFCVARFLVKPKYESSSLFYVNNSVKLGSASLSLSASDLSASQSLVDTYMVILKTRNTLESVINKEKLDYSYKTLSNMIKASSVNSTEIFKVTVTSEDPNEACKIANAIAKILPEKISEIVTGSSCKVVDYAVVDTKKVSPSNLKYSLIGALIGFVLSSAIIIIRDLLDDTIVSDSYLLENYDIPVLSVVPNLLGENNKRHYYRKAKKSERKAYERSQYYGQSK